MGLVLLTHCLLQSSERSGYAAAVTALLLHMRKLRHRYARPLPNDKLLMSVSHPRTHPPDTQSYASKPHAGPVWRRKAPDTPNQGPPACPWGLVPGLS